jgi:hypothetical protein
MTSIYLYRQKAYPDAYEQKPFHPPTILAQTQQDAYTFRPRSIQTPQQEPGRTTHGKPKLSVRSHKSPHYTADASPSQIEMKCQKPAQPPIPARPNRSAIEELRNALIYQDELRRAQHIKNENMMSQLANLPPEHLDEAQEEIKHQQTGSGYRYHKPAPINKTQKGEGKKNTNSTQEIEDAITILKGAGYRLFKSKLARGFKQVRKSRAKQKY